MALPAGISTATLTVGVPVSFSGTPLKSYISIEPSVSLVHIATGTPLVNLIDRLDTTEGAAGQFVLPHTDQDGFQDEAGNAYKNWYYTATIQYANNKATLPERTKTFQLATGQSVVDLDLLPSGNPAMPYTAPVAGVTSVNGQTGAVLVAQGNYPAARRRMYDVRDYMGVDDIGAAITRAVAAAKLDEYAYGRAGQVIVPPGNFAMTTTVKPVSGVDIIGSGPGRTIFRTQNSTIAFRHARVEDNITSNDFIRDIELVGFEIDGSELTGAQAKGTYLQYLYRVNQRWLYIHDTGATGLGNDSLAECIIEDVTVNNGGRLGGRNAAGCSGLGIGSSGLWGNGNIPDHEFGLKIINSTGRNNARFGLFFETQVQGDRQRDITVTGGSFSGNGEAGIGDCGADGLIVSGAHMEYNVEAGFTANEGTFALAPTTGINGKIVNCNIRNNGGNGIELDSRVNAGGTGYQLSGNTVKDNGGHGIAIYAGDAAKPIDRVSIRDNDVLSNGLHGVYVSGAGGGVSDLHVTNNRLISNGKSNSTQHGLRADVALTRPTITGNTATDIAGVKTQQYGLSFGATVYGATVSDNNVAGNAANATLGVQGASNFDANSNIGFNIAYTVRAGSPLSTISAPVGTLYKRLDGGLGTSLYVKEADGGASTGWAADFNTAISPNGTRFRISVADDGALTTTSL